jgi:hypothetical protein
MYYDRPPIERDPNITKMRLDVFAAIEEVAKKAFSEPEGQQDDGEVRFVSFEDAVKELVAMKQGQFV